jgi:hypothetical protein
MSDFVSNNAQPQYFIVFYAKGHLNSGPIYTLAAAQEYKRLLEGQGASGVRIARFPGEWVNG